jgi:NAD(P) transhydrogenase subunit alpha
MEGFTALYIFMLAAFTGYEVISRVPVILHTPLMSGSNFVLGHADPDDPLQLAIGFLAVFLGAANAAGGYVVTERMLGMFKTGNRKEGGAQ